MAAEKSMGTTLEITTEGSEADISDLNSIGEMGIESSEIDTTTLDSPDGYKEFIASLKDAGELPIKGIIKSEDNFQTLWDLADAQTVLAWKITTISGATLEFNGFLKSIKKGEDAPETVRTFTASIRISGKPTYTPAEVSA